MATGFDIQESTLNIDHTHKVAEFYTTRRPTYNKITARNPDFKSAEELPDGGFMVVYALDQLRGIESVLKPGNAEDRAAAKAAQFAALSPAQQAKRLEAGARLKAARAA